MVATGHAQRISPLAMARPYAVHYAPSCACAFEWRFYAHWRYCGSLTHEWSDWRASRFERSAVVRMTNLCDGISKRFRRSVLRRPASSFRLRSATFRPPCYPFDHVFFPSFLPKLYSLLPKSQQRVITRFCPTSPSVEATQCSHTTLLTTFCTAPTAKIFAGVPPNNRFQQPMSSDPAKENF